MPTKGPSVFRARNACKSNIIKLCVWTADRHYIQSRVKGLFEDKIVVRLAHMDRIRFAKSSGVRLENLIGLSILQLVSAGNLPF